eukprot:3235525-Pyramimonas_sp.AAC.1
MLRFHFGLRCGSDSWVPNWGHRCPPLRAVTTSPESADDFNRSDSRRSPIRLVESILALLGGGLLARRAERGGLSSGGAGPLLGRRQDVGFHPHCFVLLRGPQVRPEAHRERESEGAWRVDFITGELQEGPLHQGQAPAPPVGRRLQGDRVH